MIDGTKPKAETFKLVLAHLESYQSWHYICYSLHHLLNQDEISENQFYACAGYIGRMLGPCSSYNAWLMNHHPDVWRGGGAWPREGRIAWVKHIITVLES